MEKFGKIIKERRKLFSITQRELAELSEVSINTLTKIEKGEANPSIDVLQRILNTLGLEIDIKIKSNDDTQKAYYEKSKRLFTRNIRRGTNRDANK